MAGPRVAVAMSGGVDSSTAAAWLVSQGYEVVGLTMHLWDGAPSPGGGGRACCAVEDLYDARRVAERLGIPFYVLNFTDAFREGVVEEFVRAYAAGLTPNPCIRCNQRLKFDLLLRQALGLGAEFLATGHYAVRREDGEGRPQLWRGRDRAKDQSYFLFATTREQLGHLRFPLGELTKGETRGLAERFGLHLAGKRESQDVCFVPDGAYGAFLAERGAGGGAGEIVDLEGRVVGRHPGVAGFTVGQRRGLGIAAPRPLYVVRVEAAANRLVVGPEEALYREGCTVGEVNWLGEGSLSGPLELEARIRYAGEPQPARVEPLGGGRARVVFREPQRAITPGQACVWYQGERLLGGGWIEPEGE